MGLHHKARQLLAPCIKTEDIQFLDYPANSPDLHPIEHLHKTQKRLMKDFRMKISGASKDMKKKAENKMRRIWVDNPEFTTKCTIKASISYYKKLAKTSKEAIPPYSNRYNNSI